MQNEIYKNDSAFRTPGWIVWILSVSVFFNTLLAGKTFATRKMTSPPTSFDCKVKPYYKYRKDGKPGREITITFKDAKLYGPATVKVEYNSITEETKVNEPAGVSQLSVLLPSGAGVDNECQVR